MSKWLTVKKGLAKLAVPLLAGVILGLTMGWGLWVKNRQTTITEQTETEKRNSDDSLRLAKTPATNPQPQQELPKDAKVKATVSATVRPHGRSSAGPTEARGSSATALPQQPSSGLSDIRVDTTIYETKDGQSHAVVSSPDGTVISGNYSPVFKRVKLAELKNAFGVVIGASTAPSRSIGVFYDRDFAWMRVGCEVRQTTYLHTQVKDYEVSVKGGIRF